MSASSVFGLDPFWAVVIRLAVTIVVLFIVVRLIYFRYSNREGRVFTFMQMGLMIFLVCVLLKTVELQLGMALGLFAIFAIMRFRSRNLSLRDMTYFFTVIGVAVINAMATWEVPVRGMITINGVIIISIFLLETFFHREDLTVTTLIYDRLDLLQSGRLQELLKDLSERTGEKIEKVEIKKIDLIKKVSEIEIFFRSSESAK
jgi:hypothetical protein